MGDIDVVADVKLRSTVEVRVAVNDSIGADSDITATYEAASRDTTIPANLDSAYIAQVPVPYDVRQRSR